MRGFTQIDMKQALLFKGRAGKSADFEFHQNGAM